MKFWIARDKQDNLGFYYEKPTWNEWGPSQMIGDWCGGFLGYLDDNSEFPEVTFENSPQEVEIRIKDNRLIVLCGIGAGLIGILFGVALSSILFNI